MKNFILPGSCIRRIWNSTLKSAILIAGIVLVSFSAKAQCDFGDYADFYENIGSYNGHVYYINWYGSFAADAEAIAASTGGHLATIGDAGENAFIAAALFDFYWAWIGFNDAASEGNFVWVTGEPVTYTNWCAGEPNNCCIGEHWTTINWCGGGGWNDLYDSEGYDEYYWLPLVVEFDDDDDCDGVPNCNDVCDGGDDSGPCNATSWPAEIPASWYCSNNANSVKVKVCHNGTTICVSQNAVKAHLAHGDFLGPCSSCGNGGAYAVAEDEPIIMADQVKPVFNVYPNPSSGDFKVMLNQSGMGTIRVLNQNGRMVKNIRVENRSSQDISLQEPGVYLIQYVTDTEMFTQKVTVIR